MSKKISLVVATYNRSGPLNVLLERLKKQSLDHSQWEVVICDDGSSDDTSQVLEDWNQKASFGICSFRQKNQGQCVGRHEAIKRASSPLIVIIDDDMEVCDQFLEEYVKVLSADPKTVAIGRVYPRENWQSYPLYEAVREYMMTKSHEKLASGEIVPTGTYFITMNVAFHKDFYLEVGGFDKTLRLNEDCELGWRFERNGAKYAFADKASAVHHSNIGVYQKWHQRQYDYGGYGVYVWEKFEKDVYLHPLRNLVMGSKLNRAIVMAVIWSDLLCKFAVTSIRGLAAVLKTFGSLKLALMAYNAILTVQYHRGVRDKLGGLKPFNEERANYLKDPQHPRSPLGTGPTFRK